MTSIRFSSSLFSWLLGILSFLRVGRMELSVVLLEEVEAIGGILWLGARYCCGSVALFE